MKITNGTVELFIMPETKRKLYQIVWSGNDGLDFHHSEICNDLEEVNNIFSQAKLRGITTYNKFSTTQTTKIHPTKRHMKINYNVL